MGMQTGPLGITRKEKRMIIIKSLLSGIKTWLIVSLILSLIKDMTFTQALMSPYIIILSVVTSVGSYIVYRTMSGQTKNSNEE